MISVDELEKKENFCFFVSVFCNLKYTMKIHVLTFMENNKRENPV